MGEFNCEISILIVYHFHALLLIIRTYACVMSVRFNFLTFKNFNLRKVLSWRPKPWFLVAENPGIIGCAPPRTASHEWIHMFRQLDKLPEANSTEGYSHLYHSG